MRAAHARVGRKRRHRLRDERSRGVFTTSQSNPRRGLIGHVAGQWRRGKISNSFIKFAKRLNPGRNHSRTRSAKVFLTRLAKHGDVVCGEAVKEFPWDITHGKLKKLLALVLDEKGIFCEFINEIEMWPIKKKKPMVCTRGYLQIVVAEEVEELVQGCIDR